MNKRPPHAEAHGHQVHPHHRRRPDRHRPGLRVRLFGHPGLQGSEGRGLPDHPRQFQSGDDHDRSGAGGRDLHRADHAGDRRQDHRGGAPRRAAADHGRADGAQHRAGARAPGRAGGVRRRDDRRHAPTPSTRPRTASCSARPWIASGSRARAPASPHRRPSATRRATSSATTRRRALPRRCARSTRRPAGHHPSRLHARRHRRRRRLQPRGVRADRRAPASTPRRSARC